MDGNFATLLNCMDGRTQLPAINWIRENFDVDYVDIISEPGIDRVIAVKDRTFMNSLDKKMDISLNSHGSNIIFVAGHHDCAGNDTDRAGHIRHIKASVEILENLYKGVPVIGLWINEIFEVERIPG
ncbi:MAG: hypothetical protein LKE46_12180 [Clostridium sp.]|uniref:carbonic anhydrase n=1 Tax=Clostridium sp. TaxID=1506 RepID=UPI0025BCF189|nr:carbonic anhydrase [Clostridium sp.]MCH3965018.1 hypothetical protein [Clostridium sp.]MCI1714239.1 hypothetical protein [Clostridium sp.]MCI1798501.1 hypothetical protein [Clostridium sp.]MCI1812768.1 hypothetical protein [Clostridium sp.]MCI1869310.1 hypothetical protein [Clostridium sp.]